MKRIFSFFFLCSCCCVTHTQAQYYHKDIISVRQANDEILLLKEQKIKNVLVHSFEADQTESEGFYCEKKISKNFRRIEMYTRSLNTSKSLLVSLYNEKWQLVQSNDSSEITAATNVYEYDEKGNISSITSFTHSSDEDFTTSLKEKHQYIYDGKGRPKQMLKIKNDNDTSLVDFLVDEKGNVTDEIETGANGKHYYYYYNDKNQLTDIVRYNVVKKAMRPDFTFEYDRAGKIAQMIAVEEGIPGSYYNEKDAANFLTWRYFYNEEGLRIIEKCYNNKGKLLGYFEYEYK